MPLPQIETPFRKYYTFNPLQWFRSTRRIAAMVAEWFTLPPPPAGAKSFAIMVTPWYGTTVPWFSVMVGLMLGARGARVLFIFDDFPFGKFFFRSAFIRVCIGLVMRRLAQRHEVLKLSHFREGQGEPMDTTDLIARLATLNAVHALRGEMLAEGRSDYEALVRRQLHASDPAIQRLLRQHPVDAIFIPGGVCGTTGLWAEHARAAGIRVASFDAGGYSTLLLAAQGIASQLQDIPRAFHDIKASVGSPAEHDFILAAAGAELEKRHHAKDGFSSQLVATSAGPLSKYRGAILMTLNSSWDQAALGLHAVFGTNANWIRETVQWVVDHTEYTIVVRQHPSERQPVASSTDNYGAFLQQHFGNHPRVLFIAAADPINTYELLSVVSTVIAYTSTIGVEAAALGKRVIVASRSYYAGLGFVWSSSSREAYFDLIRKSQADELVLTPAMQTDAIYCYYTTQVCNWIFSPFSPQSYPTWSKESVAALATHPKVDLFLHALQENVPAAVLHHRANIATVSAAAAADIAS